MSERRGCALGIKRARSESETQSEGRRRSSEFLKSVYDRERRELNSSFAPQRGRRLLGRGRRICLNTVRAKQARGAGQGRVSAAGRAAQQPVRRNRPA
jgi:hypothetical protein